MKTTAKNRMIIMTVVLIVVLLVKPTGILGKKINVKV